MLGCLLALSLVESRRSGDRNAESGGVHGLSPSASIYITSSPPRTCPHPTPPLRASHTKMAGQLAPLDFFSEYVRFDEDEQLPHPIPDIDPRTLAIAIPHADSALLHQLPGDEWFAADTLGVITGGDPSVPSLSINGVPPGGHGIDTNPFDLSECVSGSS